jgi:STE24 endopeptidase
MRLKYRDILLWDTHGVMANAAVMGLAPQVRFVLLSDSVIEAVPDEEIKAIFAHETGHVRHYHMPLLLIFALASCSFVFLSMGLIGHLIGLDSPADLTLENWRQSLPFTGALVIFVGGWFALFGWVSRRLERQADLHAALAVSRAHDSLAGDSFAPPGHDDDLMTADEHSNAPPDKPNPGSFARGVEIVGGALRRIALLNGISTRRRSWRHSSIASRVEWLQRLSRRPDYYDKAKSVTLSTKVFVFLTVLAAAAVWLSLSLLG